MAATFAYRGLRRQIARARFGQIVGVRLARSVRAGGLICASFRLAGCRLAAKLGVGIRWLSVLGEVAVLFFHGEA